MTDILLVDDDPGTLKLLSVVLRHQGYEVRVTESAEEGWIEMNQQPPDLIISDIHMPGMSGLDLLAKIRSDLRFALTPVILLTSLRDRQDMRAGMQLGADDYITKPFRGPEIVEAVRSQLGRQAMRQAAHELRNRATLEKALQDQAQALGDDYEMRLAHALSEQWPVNQADDVEASFPQACILAIGLLDQQPWVDKLCTQDAARLLRRFHETCGDSGHLFGARLMHFHPEGAVAVFTETPVEQSQTPSEDGPESSLTTRSVGVELRALKTAFALRRSMAGLRDFMRKEWPQLMLPLPSIAMSIQTGPVGSARLQGVTGGSALTIPVGKGLSEAVALLPLARQVPASVALTAATMRKVAGAAQIERRSMVRLDGHPPQQLTDICWVSPISR